jgi:TetR/AcrR family transcriptional regulator, tetracycline repressor protein
MACAITPADREGLEAVTIRRLAQEQGVTPMAMYWHFSDTDSLLDGIAEALGPGDRRTRAGPAPVGRLPGAPGRGGRLLLLCAVITLVTSQPGRSAPSAAEDREQMFREKRAALEVLSPARYPNAVASAPAPVGCAGDDAYYALNLDLLVGGLRSLRALVTAALTGPVR